VTGADSNRFDRCAALSHLEPVSRPHRQAIVNAPFGLETTGPTTAQRETIPPDVVIGARAGDAESVRRFLEGVAPMIRRTCRGVLGAGHADLEDTMQESLLACVKALRQYRFDGDIRHYVTKIALRIAIAARRSSVSRWRAHDPLEVERTTNATGPSTDEWSTDEIDLIQRILDNLTRVQSEALLMRVVMGFSIEEIANKTGVSQNTVKTRLRLGKNALRTSAGLGFWQRFFGKGRATNHSAKRGNLRS
jgi:RNA polymerase sigma factor (sigma-70 family)